MKVLICLLILTVAQFSFGAEGKRNPANVYETSGTSTSVTVPDLSLEIIIVPSGFGQPVGMIRTREGVYKPEVQAVINEQIAAKTYGCSFSKIALAGCQNLKGFIPVKVAVLREMDIWKKSQGAQINLVLYGDTFKAGKDRISKVFVIPIQRIVELSNGQTKMEFKKYWESTDVRDVAEYSSELQDGILFDK